VCTCSSVVIGRQSSGVFHDKGTNSTTFAGLLFPVDIIRPVLVLSVDKYMAYELFVYCIIGLKTILYYP